MGDNWDCTKNIFGFDHGVVGERLYNWYGGVFSCEIKKNVPVLRENNKIISNNTTVSSCHLIIDVLIGYCHCLGH